jgi:arylsulfatase
MALRVVVLCIIAFVAACASPPEPSGPPARPNVIVILADDLAYSDLAAYGGEINTPNIDRLAATGVTFDRFFTAPMCSPSRAMLLTGAAAPRTGYGAMAEFLAPNQQGQPGYEGYLNDRVATMAEVLVSDGYQTAMAGKWHLGAEALPHTRGFQRSFALLQGAGSHFDATGYSPAQATVDYFRDGAPATLPEDFYSSDFYADQMIEYWNARDPDAPFFGYLAFSAPHWPLHAPEADIARYQDTYRAGYEALRQQRVARMIEMGLIPAGTPVPDRLAYVPAWDSLTPAEQAHAAREMAVYAAMVDRMDQAIGRLMDAIEASGELSNTIVIFTSDNGPEAIDFYTRPIIPPIRDWLNANFDDSLEALGSPRSYPFYGAGWAEAGAGPHRFFKTYVTMGGMHVPFIMSWPSGGVPQGVRVGASATMMDVAPTVYAAAGTPGMLPGRYAPDGVSMLALVRGEADGLAREGLGFELFGHETLIDGHWKLLRMRPPEGTGAWMLFDMRTDPGEMNDLSAAHPEVTARLRARYDAWAEAVGLVRAPDEYRVLWSDPHADGE